MVFKIYNQNGKIKVTKTAGYVEQVMFSDVKDGEMVEVEVGSSLWTKSHKKKAEDGRIVFPDMESTGIEKYEQTKELLDKALEEGRIDPEIARMTLILAMHSAYGMAEYPYTRASGKDGADGKEV